MIDLVKAIASDHFFDVVAHVRANPDQNPSSIARSLDLHIVTIQRSLDALERYGFVSSELRRKQGRPSRIYRYIGGACTIDLDALLAEYELRDRLVREAGRADVSFSFDVDKETVNAVLVGGRQGDVTKLDEKLGRFLWLVPPPDSKGETVAALAGKAGVPVMDAVRFALDMKELGVLELLP